MLDDLWKEFASEFPELINIKDKYIFVLGAYAVLELFVELQKENAPEEIFRDTFIALYKECSEFKEGEDI